MPGWPAFVLACLMNGIYVQEKQIETRTYIVPLHSERVFQMIPVLIWNTCSKSETHTSDWGSYFPHRGFGISFAYGPRTCPAHRFVSEPGSRTGGPGLGVGNPRLPDNGEGSGLPSGPSQSRSSGTSRRVSRPQDSGEEHAPTRLLQTCRQEHASQ